MSSYSVETLTSLFLLGIERDATAKRRYNQGLLSPREVWEAIALGADTAVTAEVQVSEVDGAPIVQIDTTFEPNQRPFRVFLNDGCIHDGEVTEVVAITQAPGDEGAAYTLTLPDGRHAVIGDAQNAYGELAAIIDNTFGGS